MMLVQTCALPIPAAFLLVSADREAVTEGCDKQTCCTALCYVSQDGVHHCVHKHTESCSRGRSSDDSSINPVFLTTLALEPCSDSWLPRFEAIGRIALIPNIEFVHYLSQPTPPPK